MPLPTNGPFSLQGHSKPGDTQQSKPKQAMIVRMSAETLEALENFQGPPKMEFEFGDNPGIYIGDTFFPIRATEENTPHELYLRSSVANRPGAPLKLHANVTGKLTVERELGESVKNSIRDRTAAAEKQRMDRRTILLETPPVLAKPTTKTATVKKRKEPTMFTKRITAADTHRTLSASSSVQASRVPSPRPIPPQPQAALTSLRARLIHLVALHRPTTEDAIHGLCRPGDSNDRKEVIKLLHEVAERGLSQPDGNETGSENWALKYRSWLDVHPYDWPSFTEAEQTRLSRLAKLALRHLNLPDSDPVWDRLRYRDTGSSGTSKTTEIKRVTDAKSSTSKPTDDRPKAKAVEQASTKADSTKAKEKDDTETQRPPLRRLPGSGYKVKAGSHTPTPPLPDRLPPNPSLPKKPEAGPPPSKREAASTSGSARPTPSSSGQERKPAVTVATKQRVVAKMKEANGHADSDRDHGRESPLPSTGLKRKKREDEDAKDSRRESPLPAPTKRNREREREREMDRDRDRPREREGAGTSSMLKRKKITREEEGEVSDLDREPAKKRKVVESGQKREMKERDLSLPKKPVPRDPSPLPPPRPKVKQEPSPLGPGALRSPRIQLRSSLPPTHSPLRPHSPMGPPSPMPSSRPVNSSRLASVSSTTSYRSKDEPHRNGSSKPRRKSPIYTSSSEDEGRPTKIVSSKREDRLDRDRRDERERGREREREHKETRHDRKDDRGNREKEESRDHRDRDWDRDNRVNRRDEKPKKYMRRSRQPLVLPSDSDGLRKMYKSRYPGYMVLYSKHIAARDKIERLLEREGDDITDSDLDSLSQEELSVLHDDLHLVEGELVQIKEAHEKLVKLGKASGRVDE